MEHHKKVNEIKLEGQMALIVLILAIILTHTVAIIRHLGGLITPPADYSACSSHGPHMPPCYSD